jgi:uncharacterized protein (UPF0276 family)
MTNSNGIAFADRDRVGLGWRMELAKDIGACLDRGPEIEFLEVIAEEYFAAADSQIAGLTALAQIVPMALHGVSLGLASTQPLEMKIADQMARLCGLVQPVFWSEHMSFVRGGGHEIGHLAAGPRTRETADLAVKNALRLRDIVGSAPALENIASLVEPPCSTINEGTWHAQIVTNSGGGMLLDLHNLYANAVNTGRGAIEMLRELPLHLVKQVHMSGGVMISAPFGSTLLLDDHVHDVAETCYTLLEELAATVDQPLYVLIERDGRYPPFSELLEQIGRARQAVATGRSRKRSGAHQQRGHPEVLAQEVLHVYS